MATELVLLGDSVLDNASYVPAGETVTDHLRATLGTSAHVTLLARDGNVTTEARHSLRALPRSATHLLVSSGGNDALWDAFLLDAAVPDIRTAFDLVGERVERFAEEYRMFLRDLAETDLPRAVCTIYDRMPGIGRAERTALSIYNDVITKAARDFGASVIDLRNILTEAADYSASSPIEPSSRGGQKLAAATAEWLLRS